MKLGPCIYRTIWRALLYTISIALVWMPAGIAPRAQTEAVESSRTLRPFRVAYLREGSDFSHAERLLENLREFIQTKNELREALERGGFGGLRLSPCDGPRDMIRRMNAGEFDLVFATAVVYVSQTGPYGEPILQTRLEGDDQAGGREAGWQRQGVIIIGRGSKVFDRELIAEDEVVRVLADEPMAVSSEFSAAGYLYPRFLLLRMGLAQPAEILFCGSDAEVVKHVITGLAPWGACRKAVLDELAPEAVRAECVRVSWWTQHFPTDPILLRSRFAPATSDIGREMKVALREFFATQRIVPELKVENAVARDYEQMANELSGLYTELARLNTAAGPGAPPLAPELNPLLPMDSEASTAGLQLREIIRDEPGEGPAEGPGGPAQTPAAPAESGSSPSPIPAPGTPGESDIDTPEPNDMPTKPGDSPKVKLTPVPQPEAPGGQPEPKASPKPSDPPAEPTAPTPRPTPVLPDIGAPAPAASGEGRDQA